MSRPITDNAPLLALQSLLARINDAAVDERVTDYLIDDADHCGQLLGRQLHASEDEQVLLRDGDEAALSVYIDERVTRRLQQHDPLQHLDDSNLADFCTAVEGISHFQYLVWSVTHQRQVSLLELELQAEVDKHAAATCLLMQQSNNLHGGFHTELHRRLFEQVDYVPNLDDSTRGRYLEANRLAARFCRRNDDRYLNCRQPRLERWLSALRELFRCGHQAKFRRALC